MNAVTQGPGNALGRLPDASSIPFVGYQVVHATLQMKERGKKHPLEFSLKEAKDPTDVASVESYVRSLYDEPLLRPGHDVSPWDLDIRKQSYVIFELEKDVANWQFFDLGLTSKHPPDDWDFGLQYVLPDGTIGSGLIPPDSGCRVIFFKVAKREERSARYFNLHVEFTQPGAQGKPKKRLKVIFDPDVGNNGGFFPPPP